MNNILNDSFRAYLVDKIINNITNVYLILSQTTSTHTKRSEFPTIDVMVLGIKHSRKSYAIKIDKVSAQPAGSDIIETPNGEYYIKDDITGLEELLWDSLYFKFSQVSPSTQVYNVNDACVISDPIDMEADIITGDVLEAPTFSDSIYDIDFSFTQNILFFRNMMVQTQLDLVIGDAIKEYEVVIDF